MEPLRKPLRPLRLNNELKAQRPVVRQAHQPWSRGATAGQQRRCGKKWIINPDQWC